MNKKIGIIFTTLLVLKILMGIVGAGFIVYGADGYLTHDQMMYGLGIDMGGLFIMAFWGIGVGCK